MNASSLLLIRRSMVSTAMWSSNRIIPTVSSSISRTRRTFFASSTDHTNLLANAVVHRLDNSTDGVEDLTYILIPDGTDIELAKRVDKLHLARLKVTKSNVLIGAKAVQRSLGTISEVCEPLLMKALEDIRRSSESNNCSKPEALASLTGLTKWVIEGMEEKHDDIPFLKELTDYEAVKAVAMCTVKDGDNNKIYYEAQEGWTKLAQQFVKLQLSEEADLYKNVGGATLASIEIMADTSREGLMDAGGSMARFKFE